MSILKKLKPENTATITIDGLNTFMKPQGKLSISAYQKATKGLDQEDVQKDMDQMAKRMGDLRRFLYDQKVPQIQFQDAHVIESIHGKRFHSPEIIRKGEEPDFVRTFPPHSLLKKNRRSGTKDQQAIDEISIPAKKQVIIPWFDSIMPREADVKSEIELLFFKDDFSMAPGNPFIHHFFLELRRQKRLNLIVLGVCDEICNLRNVLLMLSAIFNVIYIEDCTYPLDPDKKKVAINYMKNFNPLGNEMAGTFLSSKSKEILDHFSAL